MALPKIANPKFNITLPSTGVKVSFRPFIVKEEKILLMAVQSNDDASIIQAVKDVVQSCVDESIDVAKLPYFDTEYLFLNIRAKSIGEMVDLEYRHNSGINYKGEECTTVTPVKVNIEEVKVEKLDGHNNVIMLDDNMGIKLKYNTIDDISVLAKSEEDLSLLANCIDSVFQGDEVFEPDNQQDAIEFIEGLNSDQFSKIMQFFNSMPKLRHTIKYKCAGCGQEDEVKLEGLSDFF